MDLELVRVLGPIAAIIVVGVLLAYVWDKTHRPLKVDLTVTMKQRWNGGRMAPTKVPEGLALFENYATFKITDTGRYIFAAMSKERGIIVFDTDKVLYEMPANDWGAPSLDWRHDGQLIVISVSQGGTMIQIDAVPGIKKSG